MHAPRVRCRTVVFYRAFLRGRGSAAALAALAEPARLPALTLARSGNRQLCSVRQLLDWREVGKVLELAVEADYYCLDVLARALRAPAMNLLDLLDEILN